MKTANTENGPELCASCKKCGEECNSNPDSLVAGCPDYEGKLTITPQYICITCANKDSCDKEGKIPNDGYDCTEWKPKLQETQVKKDEVNHPDHYNCNSCAKSGEECNDDGYICIGWVEKKAQKDEVNHPDHYTQGGIECIDCIRASMSKDGFEDYCKGNVIKYLHRWRFKGGVQDLKKAEVYLMWLIQSAEKEEKN